MPKALTLPASRVLRAPYIETRNAGTPQAYQILIDAPLWVEWVRIYQGFKRADGLLIEAGNPYRMMGEEGFKILEEPETPYLGSALYRVDLETGRLKLHTDSFDSSD